MRLAELSALSGVPTATIKYYLREGLLPPGERVSATQAEYGEEHVRRLGLVRALIQVGRVPVATARQVLAAVEDDSVDLTTRLGTAVEALPHGPEPTAGAEVLRTAERTASALLERLGWHRAASESAAYGMLVSALTTLLELGYPCDVDRLLPYGELAGDLAVHDIDLIEQFQAPTTRLEAAVALTVLYEPVLLSLRRMAHAEESTRRFTDAAPEAGG
ncbi:MerR family transcriptional regulator [Streptomyces sp. TRM70308]|uniref:MerR family transcriptional regulator n=1 Tax=Streptomyces sp. TRM70308 TaxID=3131932 RepID=UPI003D00EF6E